MSTNTEPHYRLNVFYSPEDGGYIADIPDLKSCSAFGETPEEAVRQVQIAKSAWLDSCRANGLPLPEPAEFLTKEKAQEYVNRLLACKSPMSCEDAHQEADFILREALRAAGYSEIASAYERVSPDFWYA